MSAVVLAALLQTGTVIGTVEADSTREPLGYATVEAVGLDRRVATDARGYFVFVGLPPGRRTLRASAPGYATAERTVQVPGSGMTTVSFRLAVRPVELPALRAIAAGGPDRAAPAGLPPVRIDVRSMRSLPGLAEPDVFRMFQSLPSVAVASDFSGALYVRGGSPDQNLVRLDGAPLFNPYHLGGLFSAFDPGAVASASIQPGGFPAAMGDRLSSVIDVHTRDGGRDRVRGHGALGLVSSRLGLDGPLPGGDGGYLVTARRTYVDLFTDAAHHLGAIDWTFPYAFTDVHGKVTRDVGRFGSLTVQGYLDDEDLGFPERMVEEADFDLDLDWGTRMLAVGYRQPLGGALVLDANAGYSAFYGGYFGADAEIRFGPFGIDPRVVAWDTVLVGTTDMDDLFGTVDLAWHRARWSLHAGVQADAYRFDYRLARDEAQFGEIFPAFEYRRRLLAGALYVEGEWSMADGVDVRLGLRRFQAEARGGRWLPRVGARWRVTPGLVLRLAGGRSVQALHSLRNEESLGASLLAYDLYRAVGPGQALPTADDVTAGAEWRSGRTRIRVDAYARRLAELRLLPPPADPLSVPFLQHDGYRSGSGSAAGFEVRAVHDGEGGGFTLSYSLAWADREVDGHRFPPRFHRLHTLEGSGRIALGESGELTGRLLLGSGQPYSPVVGSVGPLEYDPGTGRWLDEPREVALLGTHNSGRLPGYFRLDVAIRKEYEKRWFGRRVLLTPYLQIVNVLNTPNVLAASPTVDSQRPELDFLPQLPFFPTFGVEWRF